VVEQTTENRSVVSSILTRGTTKNQLSIHNYELRVKIHCISILN
jgi:hypothetical protein